MLIRAKETHQVLVLKGNLILLIRKPPDVWSFQTRSLFGRPGATAYAHTEALRPLGVEIQFPTAQNYSSCLNWPVLPHKKEQRSFESRTESDGVLSGYPHQMETNLFHL